MRALRRSRSRPPPGAPRPGRPVRRGLAATVVLVVLGAATVAHATWTAARQVAAVEISSGTMDITAAWQSAPDLTALFPGNQRDGVILVEHTGQGHWRYRVTSTFDGTLRPTLTETFYPGPTCTGTPLAPGDLSPDTYPAGGTTQVCVRYELPVGAPGSLQGATSQIEITVTAENRPS